MEDTETMNNRTYLDTILILILLSGIGLLTFFRLANSPFGSNSPGARENLTADGTALFFSWLGQRGSRIQTAREEMVLGDTAVIFIIAPNRPYDLVEAELLNQWVANGGTLILIQEQGQIDHLLSRFRIRSRRLLWPRATSDVNLPTLNWPILGQFDLKAKYGLAVVCGQVAVHLGTCDQAHLVTFSQGKGQIVLLSSLYPISNEGIQIPGNARLMQNIANLVIRSGGTIVVDESHSAGPFGVAGAQRLDCPCWLRPWP